MRTPSEIISTYSNQAQISEFFSDKVGIFSILSYASGKTIYDGTTSAADALTAAIADADDYGGIVMIPSTVNGNTYYIDDNITIPSNVILWVASPSTLKVANGYTITANCKIKAATQEVFDVSLGGTISGDYFFLETNTDSTKYIWEPPTMDSTRLGTSHTVGGVSFTIPEATDDYPAGWTSIEDLYDNMWEPLRSKYSNYVTRALLGQDAGGNENIYKYVFTPESGYEKTIILSGCTHGNEYTGYYFLWQLMKMLCEEWYDYRPLHYLRNNVRIVVMPVVNPWGFINGRRQVESAVDLNRQSTYNWDNFVSSNLLSSITVSTYTASTKTITVAPDPSWSANAYRRAKLFVTAGTGTGTSSYIDSNTSNEIVLDEDLSLDNTSVFEVKSKYYKGTSAWSEVESQYVRDTLAAYSSATVYLDFHTQVTVNAHNIIYTPRFMNSPNKAIRRVIDEKISTTERIAWATSTLPSLTNYANNTYKMWGGNPEFHNGLFGALSRDSDEMTRAMWWFGNFVVEYANIEGNALSISSSEPKHKQFSLNGINDKNYFIAPTTGLEIRCVRWSGDRNTFFALDKTGQVIYQFTAARTGDISSLSYANKSYDVTSETGEFAQGFDIDPDGDFLVVVSSNNNMVYQYDLGTSDDISTAVYSATDDLDVSSETASFEVDVCLDEDCSKLWVLDNNDTSSKIFQYNLSTPKDLSTATYSTFSLTIGTEFRDPRGICVDKSAGGANYVYVCGAEAIVESAKTVTSYDTTTQTLTVTGESWTTNRFEGASLIVTAGTGIGTSSDILSNTDETIELEDDLGLDATSVFKIEDKIIRRYDCDAQDGDIDDVTLDTNYCRVHNLGVNPRTVDVNPDGSDITYLASTRNCAYQIEMSKTYYIKDWSSSTKKVQVFDQSFTDDELIGDTLTVVEGKGLALNSVITDNTTTYITLTDALAIDETSRFTLDTANYSLDEVTTKYGIKALSNEYVFCGDAGAHASAFSTVKEVEIENQSIVSVSGTMTIKTDVDCTLDVYTYLYQPYSPEFSWKKSKYSRVDQNRKRYKFTANEDKEIVIGAKIQTVPFCQGMTDTTYGTKRAQNVKMRVRFANPYASDVGLLVRDYNIDMQILPTDLGACLEIYEAEGRVRESSDQITALDEAGLIIYPDPDKFNVDNYQDGDGGTDEIDVPDVDDSTD